jgi:ABC-type maltose transport system permease subunit
MSNPTPAPVTSSLQAQRQRSIALRLIIAVLLIYFSIFPILLVISAALNPGDSLSSGSLLPRDADGNLKVGLDNFKTLLAGDPTWGCGELSDKITATFTGPTGIDSVIRYCTWLRNSIKIAAISTVLSVSITTMAAFAFSRFRFKGRQAMLKGILLINVFPGILALVSVFLLIAQLGDVFSLIPITPGGWLDRWLGDRPLLGLDTHAALILVYMGGSMGINIWLMKGYLDTIPRDIDESAMVDGATHWQIFTRLILPLLRPILIVVGILSFIGTYGDFVLARILLKTTEQYTLMVGLQIFTAGQFSQKWGPFAAGALIGALPLILIYLLLQDYIVGGLTQGAVKG